MANAPTQQNQNEELERQRQSNAELQRQIDLMRQQEELSRQQTAAITADLPPVELERLGGAEEQAQRAQLARELMAQQQAGQRQLLSQQAKQGVRGGAASAQQSRLQQQIAAQRAAQEEQGFLGRRMFNIEQAQKEQFAKTAAELARRQLMASLRGQELQAQAAERFGQQQLQTAQASGGGGTVICTELHKQGFMDEETFQADQKFGAHLMKFNPDVMIGYWTVAQPIVALMKASRVFSRLVNFFAAPWAKEMAHQVNPVLPGSRFGSVIMVGGLAFCGFIGRFRVRIKAYGAN